MKQRKYYRTTISFKNHFDEDIELILDEHNNLIEILYDKIKIDPEKIDKVEHDIANGQKISQQQIFTHDNDPKYLPVEKIKNLVRNYHQFSPKDWEEIMSKLFVPVYEKIMGMKRFSKKEKEKMNKKMNEFIDMQISFNELLKHLPRY